MNRTPSIFAIGLLLLAAAGAPAVAAPPAAAASATAPPSYEPAPMPNQDLFAPVQRASEDPEISPTVFKPGTQFRGDGYSPGSTSQSYEERHLLPGYGVNLSVPLK
jgi:hypothetical protein